MFNSTAKLLSDNQCKNDTGVSGVEIGNVGSAPQTAGENATAGGGSESPKQTGAASHVSPVLGTSLVAAVLAWGLL